MKSDDLIIQDKLEEVIRYVLQPPAKSNFLIINRTSNDLSELAEKAATGLGLKARIFSLDRQGPYYTFPSELIEEIRSLKYPRAMGFFTYQDKEWKQKETPARVKLIHETIMKTPIGYAHGPGIDRDMILNGAGRADIKKMSHDAEKLLGLLDGVEKVEITASAGTNIDIEIPSELKWKTDCKITPPDVYGNPGNMGNIPMGEVCIFKRKEVSVAGKKVEYPIRLVGSGTIVCDVCADNIDKLIDPARPIRISLEGGVLTDFSSEDEDFNVLYEEWKSREAEYKEKDKEEGLKAVLEEFGIGINNKARILGNLLETEKLAETIHLAIGHVDSHADFIVSKPTVLVTYKDRSERTIMENGNLILD